VIGPRRFPPPWSVEERPTAFVCGDHNSARVCPLTVIIFTFLVPRVLLRKLVSLASIASAIAMTTLVAGFGLYLAARSSIEKRTPRCERIDNYLQASILIIIRDVFCCDRRPHHGYSRCFISRKQLGHAERRSGLFLENCMAAPDGRSYTQGHIRTGLRLHSHIVDRHRSVFRSSLFLAG
jgi:hypothetical protein